MKRIWTISVMVSVIVLCLAGTTVWAQEGKGQSERRAKLNEIRQALREIDQELRPVVQEALKADEALADLDKQRRETQRELFKKDVEVRTQALDALAKAQPDLAETVQLIKELGQKTRELYQQMRQGGEGAEGLREEVKEVQKDQRALWQTIQEPYRKIMAEDEQVKAAQAALQESRKAAGEMNRDFEQKMAAKILEVSPESKDLLEQRKELMKQQQAMFRRPQGRQGGRRPRLTPEQQEKAKELRAQMGELARKLWPVRQKVMQDPEVRELNEKLQTLVEAKMLEAAPELADTLKQQKGLMEQLQQIYQPKPQE